MKKVLAFASISFLCFSMSAMSAIQVEAETVGSWLTRTSLPQPADTFGLAAANGKIFLIGGQIGGPSPYVWTNANYEYDPLSDSWSSKASMPTKRGTLAVASVNNRIYAIGGAASVSGGTYSTNEEFDPMSNSWSVKAPMPTARNWITAAVVNDKIYIVGGSDNSGGRFAEVQIYDPSSNSWSMGAPPQHSRLAYGVGVVNNKIYLIGGLDDSSYVSTLNEEYNPETDTWTTKTPMPTGRNGFAVAVVNNRIYAIGGAVDFNPWTNNLNVVEEYDPTTDTWRTVQSMPTSRSLLSAAAISNKIYAIGGWGSAGYLGINEQFGIQSPASLVLTPSTGFASTTLQGHGFSTDSKLTVTWDGTKIPTVPSPLISDADGNFTAIVSVPMQNTLGSHTIKASDELGIEASAAFTVVDMTGPQGLSGETRDFQLLVNGFTIGAAILAICIATIALVRRRH